MVNEKRVQLTVQQLSENMYSLVQHAYTLPSPTEAPNIILVGKRVKHTFKSDADYVEDEQLVYYGKVVSQVSIK